MKAIQGVILFFSILITQVPAFLIFREDAFVPPFGSGKLLFLLATEVLCLMIFSLVILNKKRIQRMSLKRFQKRVLILFTVFISSGILYFLILMNNVVQDSTTEQRTVLPIFVSKELKSYLRAANEESRMDVASINEEINSSGWNVFFYYLTYCLFFLMFNILFATVVSLFAFLGLKMVEQDEHDTPLVDNA